MAIQGYTRMDQITLEQWNYTNQCFEELIDGLTDRIVNTLLGLRGHCMGSQVDRFEHCLQTATRALRDGADEEIIVCALLHDIGDDLAPYNHGRVAASILEPYISEHNAWMLANHEVFQGYYFHEFIDRDPNERDKFKTHPAYEQTITFCDRWDQLSFDPTYDTLSLSIFRPILESILRRQPRSPEQL